MFLSRPMKTVGTAVFVLFAASMAPCLRAATASPEPIPSLFKQYCTACHGKAASGGINLEQLTANPAPAENFAKWQKVITALEEKRMPPAKMPQPAEPERAAAASWVRASLKDYAQKHAGDPGPVTVRRLT